MSRPDPTPKLKNEPLGWVLVGVASMFWGTDLLFRPLVLKTGMGSVALVMVEHLALTAIFAPAIVLTWRTWTRLSRTEIAGLLFIAWGGSGLATVLLTKAYAAGEPFTATLLQKLQPAFAITLAGPILKERPKRMFILCFAFAIVGAYLMSFGLTWITDPLSKRAVLSAELALGAAALWGACTVIGRWSLQRLEPFTVAGLRFALALPLLVGWNLFLDGSAKSKFSMPVGAWLPLLAIVLLPDALGMALYYFGLRRTTASLATLAELAYPATAVILAYPSTHTFTAWKWLGLIVLIVSLYVIKQGDFITAPADPETLDTTPQGLR